MKYDNTVNLSVEHCVFVQLISMLNLSDYRGLANRLLRKNMERHKM